MFLIGYSRLHYLPRFTSLDIPSTTKKIICAAEDLNGLLYIGTKGTVYQFDGMQYVGYALPDSLQEQTVNSLLFVEHGFYAGLNGGQLLFFDNQQPAASPKLVFQLDYPPINQLLTDNKNQLWISTYGGGIFISQENKILHHLSTKKINCQMISYTV